MPKMVNFGDFLKTALPDRSVLIGQKLVENTKWEKFKGDILSNFQTFWAGKGLVRWVWHELRKLDELWNVNETSCKRQKSMKIWID